MSCNIEIKKKTCLHLLTHIKMPRQAFHLPGSLDIYKYNVDYKLNHYGVLEGAKILWSPKGWYNI